MNQPVRGLVGLGCLIVAAIIAIVFQPASPVVWLVIVVLIVVALFLVESKWGKYL